MKRHGYKGAFELAATVDYMFGYDATAQVIEDWMYEDVTESYVLDPETQRFFQQSNPWALKGIVERLLEAIERGLWEEPSQEMLRETATAYTWNSKPTLKPGRRESPVGNSYIVPSPSGGRVKVGALPCQGV